MGIAGRGDGTRTDGNSSGKRHPRREVAEDTTPSPAAGEGAPKPSETPPAVPQPGHP